MASHDGNIVNESNVGQRVPPAFNYPTIHQSTNPLESPQSSFSLSPTRISCSITNMQSSRSGKSSRVGPLSVSASVAADVSRRTLFRGKLAPTNVGGYVLSDFVNDLAGPLTLLTVLSVATVAAAEVQANWPRWRGPQDNGSTEAGGFPTKWEVEKVLWK